MNSVQTSVMSRLPKSRKSSSGWISFNAVCCHHHGERPDTRGRGGIITNGDGLSYHCFNCGFKTGWKPGRHIGYKFRKLLNWLGVDKNEIQRLVFQAFRLKESVTTDDDGEYEDFVFDPKPVDLPERLDTLATAKPELAEYVTARGLDPHQFFWSDTLPNGMRRRVIIPFTWYNKIVGWTARSVDDRISPKYITKCAPNYVYGVDQQSRNAKIAIAAEGVFDALSIGGIATLGHEVTEEQAQLIDTLGREIVLLPDRGASGQLLIDYALEYGWSVSFPEWESDIKDINDAVVRYGRLFTVKTIIDAKQSSAFKIKLLRRHWD